MSENDATALIAPTKTLINAYKVWAKGNGILRVKKALGEPRNQNYMKF